MYTIIKPEQIKINDGKHLTHPLSKNNICIIWNKIRPNNPMVEYIGTDEIHNDLRCDSCVILIDKVKIAIEKDFDDGEPYCLSNILIDLESYKITITFTNIS